MAVGQTSLIQIMSMRQRLTGLGFIRKTVKQTGLSAIESVNRSNSTFDICFYGIVRKVVA